MNTNIPEASKAILHLHIFDRLDLLPSDEIQVDLEEERKQLQEQEAVEEYWAGRNLAMRNSTRRAA
jgi:hypothetical protein